MKGKRVVVTGASRGIGRVTALELAAKGADLALVVRNETLGREVVHECKGKRGGGTVSLFVGDMSSMADVRRVANEIGNAGDRLDVLLNNAGAILSDRITTVDGYEATFATNHLAYFLMTKLLLPALEKTPGARVVSVASAAHRGGALDFDDLMSERGYMALRVYSTSKLANILFARELATRLGKAGKKVTSNSLHPGAIASNFARENGGLMKLLWSAAAPFLLSEEKGARTQIFLCSDDAVAGVTGKYFVKCKEERPSRAAQDDGAARRLWERSEELVSAFV